MLRGGHYWKTYQLSIIITLSAGLLWAFCSDALISYFDKNASASSLRYIRSLNNVLLFGVMTTILYLRIRKQQYRLVLSIRQYRSLFESNPNPMWLYHRDTLYFVAVNDAAVVKYGYSREDFLGMTIWDIRSSADHALLDKEIKGNPGGLRESGIWKHLRKSGETFPVSIVSHDVFFDQQPCKMVMATDITQIIQSEKKLRDAYLKEKQLHEELAIQYATIRQTEKENRMMAQVTNNINNLVLIVQEGDLISWANWAFCDFTGYTLNEITGKNPREILSGPQTDPDVTERLLHAVEQKIFFSEELVNYKKNGEPYWTQLTISPIYDENKVFQFYVSVGTVITEKKEKEQELLAQHIALQKIAWLNSHELRRPVCSIMGLISLLKIVDDGKDRDDCLNKLEICAEELDQLIKEVNQKTESIMLTEKPAN